MSIAEKIATDVYLTLDAEVICVKPVTFLDLVKDRGAVCYVHEVNRFADWYSWAECIL